MTGSKLPPGADTVIPAEDIIENKDSVNYLNNILLRKGMNVRCKGEDIRKYNLLIRKNTILRSNNIALAASCGKKTIRVYSKLKIGILATGDELVDINIKPKNDKTRASNLYSLLSAIGEMNMEPVSFGIVKDEKEEIKKRIKDALNSDIDILITTGGISAGKHDLLKNIFENLNVKIKFSQVNIKPGKPITFGVYAGKEKSALVFGLPGNPVSCYVGFILFVRNVIMNKFALNKEGTATAILNATLIKQDNKRHFLRGVIHNKNGTNFVSKIGSQSSANIGGLNSANCLMVLKEDHKILKKGKSVECIMI
jgi:molybdopterin molybdotransferase